MHVLILALHRPTKPTGVCRHAANLAQCLADLDAVDKVTLVVGEWQWKYFQQSFNLKSAKVDLMSIDIKNSSPRRNRWFLFGLPKLVRQIQPDMVHMSFPFPFIRQWLGVPVVSTIHDMYPYECPENFGYPRVWFNQLFLRQCIYSSDGLICVSKCTLEALNTYFPETDQHKQIAVVYNIVDFSEVHSTTAIQLKEYDLSQPFVLTVGQHRKNKNLDLLIEAFSLLRRNRRLEPETKLLLVGSSGPETDNLNQLVSTLELDKQVLFLSNLTDGELRWLYEHAAVFVAPSSSEGFCLPLVEALTLGCRVVCSDIPIFREVGASHCHFFNLNADPIQALSEQILIALSLPRPKASVLEAQFAKPAIAQSATRLLCQAPVGSLSFSLRSGQAAPSSPTFLPMTLTLRSSIPDKPGTLKNSALIVAGFATAFFPRLFTYFGAPAPLNFLHLAIVPGIAIAVLATTRVRHSRQIQVVLHVLTGIGIFLTCIAASAFVSDAGLINVVLQFVLFSQPFVLLATMLAIPTSLQSRESLPILVFEALPCSISCLRSHSPFYSPLGFIRGAAD